MTVRGPEPLSGRVRDSVPNRVAPRVVRDASNFDRREARGNPRLLLHQRGPVQHDVDGRSGRLLVLSHVDQESPAVGRGLRGRDHVSVRREG